MNEKRVMKSFDELKFSDDFMFGKVMEDRELCRELLECLLQRPVGELREVQTQREFKFTEDGKPIRLDVYNEDIGGSVYDAEMQNLNKKSVEYHQLPKRSRFYQSSIDIDYLDKKHSYKSLPNCAILFICTFDPFMKGLCKYIFRYKCEEDNGIVLGDGTEKMFFNCSYKGEAIPGNLRRLYDYIETGYADDNLTNSLKNAVEQGRKNQEWRSQYMKEITLLQDAKDDRDYEKIEDMLRRGKTVEEIVDFCGYPYEQVKQVEKSLMQTVS